MTIRAISAPFSQTDWLNPVTRLPPQHEVGPNNTLRQVAVAPVVLPFSLNDWANPVTRVAAQQDVGANYTLRQVVPAVLAPFKQIDWANPVTRIAAQQEPGANYTLWQVASTPFKQTDWPNPQFRAPHGIAFYPAYIDPSSASNIAVRVTGVTGFGTIGQVIVLTSGNWTPIDDSQSANWVEILPSPRPCCGNT